MSNKRDLVTGMLLRFVGGAREGRVIIFIDESGTSERPHRVIIWDEGSNASAANTASPGNSCQRSQASAYGTST
jgi:hypothetical protein